MGREDQPQRRHARLRGYDYGQDGAYFVTICSKDRAQIFGTIPVGRGAHTPPQICLSEIGQIAQRYILNIPHVYSNVSINIFTIMPNHIHLLVGIQSSQNGGGMWASRPTLQTIIRSFKTMVSKAAGRSVWQNSFYEHIVRSEEDYLAIWQYIEENPLKWELDKYHS